MSAGLTMPEVRFIAPHFPQPRTRPCSLFVLLRLTQETDPFLLALTLFRHLESDPRTRLAWPPLAAAYSLTGPAWMRPIRWQGRLNGEDKRSAGPFNCSTGSEWKVQEKSKRAHVPFP